MIAIFQGRKASSEKRKPINSSLQSQGKVSDDSLELDDHDQYGSKDELSTAPNSTIHVSGEQQVIS